MFCPKPDFTSAESHDAICLCSWYSVTMWVLKGQPRVAGCGLTSVVLEREVVQIGPHSQQTGVPSGPGSSPTPSLTHLTRQLHWDVSPITFHHPTCFSPVAYTNLENICLHSNITRSSSPGPLLMPNMFFLILLMTLQNKIFHLCPGKRTEEKKQERKTEEEKNFHLPKLLDEPHHTFITLPSPSSRPSGKISTADRSTGDLEQRIKGRKFSPDLYFCKELRFSVYFHDERSEQKKKSQLLPWWNTYCSRMLHALCQRIRSIDFLKWKISLR